MLETDRIFLIPASFEMLDSATKEDYERLSALLGGVDIADNWSQFPDAMFWMRDYIEEHPDQLGWWNYFLVHRKDLRLIGNAGYKGPPLFTGEVEVGYEIVPAYQNQGLATAVTKALCNHAFQDPGVLRITAHTLAEENASCKVLRKCGFLFVEAVEDMEEGVIWKWVLVR